jgi:hypothetical protein
MTKLDDARLKGTKFGDIDSIIEKQVFIKSYGILRETIDKLPEQ